MHHGELTIAACMRVSVFIRRRAVGRPAGVTYACGAVYILAALCLFRKVFNSFGSFAHRQIIIVKYRYSGRIVAPVFKSFKTLKQKSRRLCFTCKSNYSAHKNTPFRSSTERRSYPL